MAVMQSGMTETIWRRLSMVFLEGLKLAYTFPGELLCIPADGIIDDMIVWVSLRLWAVSPQKTTRCFMRNSRIIDELR